jgi:pyruvate,water dikinase
MIRNHYNEIQPKNEAGLESGGRMDRPPMAEENCYWLEEIQSSNRLQVGDRAFYLSLLKRRGVPVLPGFVISSAILEQFLQNIRWLEPLFTDFPESSLHLNVDDPRQLQAVAQQIRQSIEATPLSEAWLHQMVDAIASWNAPMVTLRPSIALQGQLDPVVGSRIRGLLSTQQCTLEPGENHEAIAQALKLVWAELFRARSLFYWQRSRIQLQHIRLAVLIQPVWQSLALGEVQIRQQRLEIRAASGEPSDNPTPEVYVLGTDTIQNLLENESVTRSLQRPLVNPSAVLQVSEPRERSGQVLRHPSVLNPNQLQTLAQLGQQVQAALGDDLNFEWMLAPGAEASSTTFFLTEVVFQGRRAEALRPSQPSPPIEANAPIQDPSAPNAMPVLTGLAAAAGKILAPVWVPDPADYPTVVPSGAALVVPQLAPVWVPYLKQAAALITEQGGLTSHAAILAREKGIPAVVGVTGATTLLRSGEVVCVDGDRGTIHRIPATSLEMASPEPVTPPESLPLPENRGATATRLMVNLSQSGDLESWIRFPVDGVGLLRSEHLFADLLPQLLAPDPDASSLIQQMVDRLQSLVQTFASRPVFYRSLDVLHRPLASSNPATASRPEHNPILGIHGTFAYQFHPQSFALELATLRQFQQLGYGNLKLLLPFVRTVEEFQAAAAQVMQAGLMQSPDFQLWIMAEVPSVLFLLPDYVSAGVQGISIGSNDLTQLLLAIDRDDSYGDLQRDRPSLVTGSDRHPAVLRAIQHLIQESRRLGIPCSICGELPSRHPDLIDELVRWGIHTISVHPGAIEPTYRAIVRAERNLLLEAARRVSDRP